MKEIIGSVNNFMKNYDYYEGLKIYCDNEYKGNSNYVFNYVKKFKKFPY